MKSTLSRLLCALLCALCVSALSVRAADALTTNETAARLQQLRAEIAHHDELYFKRAAPEISDAAYDALKRELRALELRFPALAAADPSTGDDRSGNFATARHRARMQGLGKVYTEAELRAFLAKTRRALGRDGEGATFIVEPKYDGLAISLTYEHGRLVRAVTRGDGVEGDEVTANLLALCDVPRALADGAPIPAVIELRGEVFMTFAEFKRINTEVEAGGGEPYAHPRNLAAGTLKQVGAVDTGRRLTAVVYGWGAVEPAALAPASQRELHRLVRAWGLPAVSEISEARTDDEVWCAVQEIGTRRMRWTFPTDGAVVKLDATDARVRLGDAEEVPRWAVAFKFSPAQATTRLRAITLQVGRTGAITPVAELDPVKLAGATIRRVSLHNREEIARRDLRLGDTVTIERAGEIIPVITSVDRTQRAPESAPFQFPEVCPSCRTRLLVLAGQAVVRCPNRDCPAQIQRRLEHFAADECVDLQGFGPGVIEKLVTRGLLREPADFFQLAEPSLREAVGAKTAAKLLAAVERGRTRENWRFVLGLGVPDVGAAAAKALARRFTDLESLASAPRESLVDGRRSRVAGLSDNAAVALAEFLEVAENRAALVRLQRAREKR